MARRTTRDEAIVPVRLWGMDVKCQPFIEAAWTGNVSAYGALLKGAVEGAISNCRVHWGEPETA